jgi:hypothetical protein
MPLRDPTDVGRHGVTAWRVSPQRLSWIVLIVGVAACLLLPSGCGTADPRGDPSPDIVVTTLDEKDLETVSDLLRVQHTIRLGLATGSRSAQELPPDVAALVAQIAGRWESRERDLRAFTRLKNVPEPELIGDRHLAWLAEMDAATGEEWPSAVLEFHERTQRELLRLLRVAGDEAADRDLRDLAVRNRAGTVALLDRLAQVDDAQ